MGMRVVMCMDKYGGLKAWFKVAVSVTDSEGPEVYWSQCIGLVSSDT